MGTLQNAPFSLFVVTVRWRGGLAQRPCSRIRRATRRLRTGHSKGLQLLVNTWTPTYPPIHLSTGLECRFDLLRKFGIFSAMVAGFAFVPGVEPAHRHLQHLTHHRYRILLLVISNELIPYSRLREKMPSAFFTLSRSC